MSSFITRIKFFLFAAATISFFETKLNQNAMNVAFLLPRNHHRHSKHLPIFHKSRKISSRTSNYLIRFNLMSCKNVKCLETAAFPRSSTVSYRRWKTNIPRALNPLTDDALFDCLFKEIDSVNYFSLFFPLSEQIIRPYFQPVDRFIFGFPSILNENRESTIGFCCKNIFSMYLATGRCFLVPKWRYGLFSLLIKLSKFLLPFDYSWK